MVNKRIFEEVSCNLCGSTKFSIIYPERYENEKDGNLTQKFRASGDELLIDRLVKCKRCNLIFISPRIRSDVIVESYSKGEDPLFVSQAESREKTFFSSLKKIEKYFVHKGKILDVGTAGGSFLAAAKR